MANNEKFTFDLKVTITGVKQNRTTDEKGNSLEWYTAIARCGGRLVHLSINKAIYDMFKSHSIVDGDIWLAEKTKLQSDDSDSYES
jgi:hypothetical protein